MDRGTWWTTVHGVAESGTTEETEQQQQAPSCRGEIVKTSLMFPLSYQNAIMHFG